VKRVTPNLKEGNRGSRLRADMDGAPRTTKSVFRTGSSGRRRCQAIRGARCRTRCKRRSRMSDVDRDRSCRGLLVFVQELLKRRAPLGRYCRPGQFFAAVELARQFGFFNSVLGDSDVVTRCAGLVLLAAMHPCSAISVAPRLSGPYFSSRYLGQTLPSASLQLIPRCRQANRTYDWASSACSTNLSGESLVRDCHSPER
jgi:hypothetical protein